MNVEGGAARSWPLPAARTALLACVLAWTVGAITVAALAGLASTVVGDAGAVLAEGSADGVSEFARRDIPPAYLSLYQRAAAAYGLDWAVLAAVGRVECDHGRDPDPSCLREGAVNSAGAGGPMQFLASTWAAYGVDGDGDGVADRWDPADAIFSAANYLRAAGGARDIRSALFTYNHATWYVDEVLAWARRYRAPTATPSPPAVLPGDPEASQSTLAAHTSTPVEFVAGTRALLGGDGHLALVPAGVPLVVQAMIVAGNELQRLPYGPAGHPDPRNAPAEDCSSTVNYVLYRAGIRPIGEILAENPLAQGYVGWGLPGPGRWVTIYATATPTPHVFIVIAGLRLDTSGAATDVGPNRFEGGPRWRILDHIPTWARWSVRHPPGL